MSACLIWLSLHFAKEASISLNAQLLSSQCDMKTSLMFTFKVWTFARLWGPFQSLRSSHSLLKMRSLLSMPFALIPLLPFSLVPAHSSFAFFSFWYIFVIDDDIPIADTEYDLELALAVSLSLEAPTFDEVDSWAPFFPSFPLCCFIDWTLWIP